EADAQWDLLLRNATSVQTRAVLESLVHTASLMATQENDPQGVEMLCTLQDYLAAHAFDPLLNLGQVVDAFGQSASIISRLCKKHFGMTFVDYISYLRMQKARALLSRTDLKLKEIVEQIGYSDVANFIRKFRLLEGMTPGEWRKVHAEEK
ncbi:MAG: helix-turn-helix transcriptional regulator, partial [Clostridia bacterium]